MRNQTIANSLLLASIEADHCGLKKITIIEFGVANGTGLLDLCKLADYFSKMTGMKYRIFGFDTGEGMPAPVDYRDHPEIWKKNQFNMKNKDQLLRQLPDNAQILFGDVRKTVPQFMETLLSAESPVGFVVLDLDYYSLSKEALKLFKGNPRWFLPSVVMYVDDVECLLTYNSRCGEMLAINEFNNENDNRIIEKKSAGRKGHWRNRRYCCHILAHPIRTGEIPCEPMEISLFAI